MHPFRADLHCHTSSSDGSLSPAELIQIAAEVGLQGLSITDHDTVAAYPLAIEAARQHSISLISGVEFSATLDSVSVHILGYAFSLSHPALHNFCRRHAGRREERNREILDRLNKLGMPLTIEEVLADNPSSVGRPHIAQAMVNKLYVSSIQEAFKRFIGDGRPAFAKGSSVSVDETLDIIHQTGGMAVIAHPHLIQNIPMLRKLLEMPFDGIECFYARFPADSNLPWIELAQKRGWLMTGGSDFHGDAKPTIPLGASWVGEETFRYLEAHHLTNNAVR